MIYILPACVILVSVLLVPWFVRARNRDAKFRKRTWARFAKRMNRHEDVE